MLHFVSQQGSKYMMWTTWTIYPKPKFSLPVFYQYYQYSKLEIKFFIHMVHCHSNTKLQEFLFVHRFYEKQS